jgi:hypothetical protein
VEDEFGSVEDEFDVSESSEDDLYSSDGKRKLDESEDGGAREGSCSIYFSYIDGSSLEK